MPGRHLVRTADQAAYTTPPAFADLSEGFRRWSVVNDEAGSVHQEFGICELDAGGTIDAHAHSFEESVYMLEGAVLCDTGEGSFLLEPGDYGMIPVAAVHRFRNT